MRSRYCLGVVLLLLLIAGCGDEDERPRTVQLAVNPWTGSAVNAAVARILIEEELGQPVRIVEIDEFSQWEEIERGNLDAALEVWPSGHRAEIATFIEQRHSVEDGGPLGVVGKIGWYVPAYVVDDHPELRRWEGLRDAANVALFRTSESGARGQFLAGDPTWVQYDDQIIANLGLDFERVFAGSEAALLQRLDTAYAQRQPLLFYFFTPHSAHMRYDLIEVELPPYSDACFARAAQGGIDCDYPTDHLFKIFWPGLRAAAPAAHALLSRLSYTTEDQIDMIALVESGGLSPEQAARAWLAQHEGVWRDWISAAQNFPR